MSSVGNHVQNEPPYPGLTGMAESEAETGMAGMAGTGMAVEAGTSIARIGMARTGMAGKGTEADPRDHLGSVEVNQQKNSI